MSSLGRKWMGLVARVPCVLCDRMGISGSPAQVHHMKMGTGAAGAGRRDTLVIALCYEHHQGKSGVHQLKEHGLQLRYKCGELDLLADTIEGVTEIMLNRVDFHDL